MQNLFVLKVCHLQKEFAAVVYLFEAPPLLGFCRGGLNWKQMPRIISWSKFKEN
jgi:hypothetical protein